MSTELLQILNFLSEILQSGFKRFKVEGNQGQVPGSVGKIQRKGFSGKHTEQRASVGTGKGI